MSKVKSQKLVNYLVNSNLIQLNSRFIFKILKKFSFSNLSLFQTEKVEQGEVVIRQGDDGDYFYVIQKLVYQFKYDKI